MLTPMAKTDNGQCSCTGSRVTSQCNPDNGEPTWSNFADKNDVYWCQVGDPKGSYKCSGAIGCDYNRSAGPKTKNDRCFTECKKGE